MIFIFEILFVKLNMQSLGDCRCTFFSIFSLHIIKLQLKILLTIFLWAINMLLTTTVTILSCSLCAEVWYWVCCWTVIQQLANFHVINSHKPLYRCIECMLEDYTTAYACCKFSWKNSIFFIWAIHTTLYRICCIMYFVFQMYFFGIATIW